MEMQKCEVIVLEIIHKLIDTAVAESANFPPTLIFNEGWLLRLVLDWYSRNKNKDQPLIFQPRSTWFSEALLPSPFRPRYRGDTRGEARTHADGIIGHFSIGSAAKADAKLLEDATQLIVVEAKMFSPLSGGTRNAPNFNQAARSVSCITELLKLANRPPSQLTDLAFYVVAPEEQISAGIFFEKMNKNTIQKIVETRAESFANELGSWVDKWFYPTIETIKINTLPWESLIDCIESYDQNVHHSLIMFYHQCLIYNRMTRMKSKS
jgi:hypothetical protein